MKNAQLTNPAPVATDVNLAVFNTEIPRWLIPTIIGCKSNDLDSVFKKTLGVDQEEDFALVSIKQLQKIYNHLSTHIHGAAEEYYRRNIHKFIEWAKSVQLTKIDKDTKLPMVDEFNITKSQISVYVHDEEYVPISVASKILGLDYSKIKRRIDYSFIVDINYYYNRKFIEQIKVSNPTASFPTITVPTKLSQFDDKLFNSKESFDIIDSNIVEDKGKEKDSTVKFNIREEVLNLDIFTLSDLAKIFSCSRNQLFRQFDKMGLTITINKRLKSFSIKHIIDYYNYFRANEHSTFDEWTLRSIESYIPFLEKIQLPITDLKIPEIEQENNPRNISELDIKFNDVVAITSIKAASILNVSVSTFGVYSRKGFIDVLYRIGNSLFYSKPYIESLKDNLVIKSKDYNSYIVDKERTVKPRSETNYTSYLATKSGTGDDTKIAAPSTGDLNQLKQLFAKWDYLGDKLDWSVTYKTAAGILGCSNATIPNIIKQGYIRANLEEMIVPVSAFCEFFDYMDTHIHSQYQEYYKRNIGMFLDWLKDQEATIEDIPVFAEMLEQSKASRLSVFINGKEYVPGVIAAELLNMPKPVFDKYTKSTKPIIKQSFDLSGTSFFLKEYIDQIVVTLSDDENHKSYYDVNIPTELRELDPLVEDQNNDEGENSDMNINQETQELDNKNTSEQLINPIEWYGPGQCPTCHGPMVVADSETTLMKLDKYGRPYDDKTYVRCEGKCLHCRTIVPMMRDNGTYRPFSETYLLMQRYEQEQKAKERLANLPKIDPENPFAL